MNGLSILINIFSPIIFIVLLAFILYFISLKIKISQEKLKYYQNKNNEFSNEKDLGKYLSKSFFYVRYLCILIFLKDVFLWFLF